MDVSYSMRDDMETMKVVGEKMSAKAGFQTNAAFRLVLAIGYFNIFLTFLDVTL